MKQIEIEPRVFVDIEDAPVAQHPQEDEAVSEVEITERAREIAKEAARRTSFQGEITDGSTMMLGVQLALDGWKPADPDLILVREEMKKRWTGDESAIDRGEYDRCSTAIIALAAIKRVRASA